MICPRLNHLLGEAVYNAVYHIVSTVYLCAEEGRGGGGIYFEKEIVFWVCS